MHGPPQGDVPLAMPVTKSYTLIFTVDMFVILLNTELCELLHTARQGLPALRINLR